jgi:hypothetical protein
MDFASVAKSLREWKAKLIKRLNDLGKRATPAEILAIAEIICPTKHNFGGGQLFLSWFEENGKKSIRERVEEEEAKDGKWSEALRLVIRAVEVPRWVMSVICTANCVSQKNTRQLFYPSLVLEWKGLSRTGMDIYAHLGAALQAKQYLKMKKELARTEKEVSRKIFDTKNPVVWADNYSKVRRPSSVVGNVLEFYCLRSVL